MKRAHWEKLGYFVLGLVLGVVIYVLYAAAAEFVCSLIFRVMPTGVYFVPAIAALGTLVTGSRESPMFVGVLSGMLLACATLVVLVLLYL